MNQKSLKDLVDEELPNPSSSKTSMRDLLENTKHSSIDVIENTTRSNNQFALQSNFNNQIGKSNTQIYLPQNPNQFHTTILNPTNFEHRKSQPTFHSTYDTTQQSIDRFTFNDDFLVGFSNPKNDLKQQKSIVNSFDSKTTKNENSDDEFEIHLDDGTDHIHFEINQSGQNDALISFHNSLLSNFNQIESNKPNNHSINESETQIESNKPDNHSIDLIQKRDQTGQICFQNVLDKPFNNQFNDSQNENSLRSHFLEVDHQFSGDSNTQHNNDNSLFDENDSNQMINQDEKWSPDVSLFDTIQTKSRNPMLKETTSNEQHLILLNKSEPNLFHHNSTINQNDSIEIQFPSDFLSADDISIQQRRGAGLPAAFGFGSQELEREYFSQKTVNKPNVDIVNAHINPENDVSDDKIEIYTPKNEFSEGFVFPEFEQSSKYEITNEIHLDLPDEESSNELNENSGINSKNNKIIDENKDQITLDLNEKEIEFKPSFDGFTFQSASNDNTNEIHLELSEEDLHENGQQEENNLKSKEIAFKPSFDDFQFNDKNHENTNEIRLDLSEEDLNENDQLEENNLQSKEIDFKPSFDNFKTRNDDSNEIKLNIKENEDLNEDMKLNKNEVEHQNNENEFNPSFATCQFEENINQNTNEIHLDLSDEEDKHETNQIESKPNSIPTNVITNDKEKEFAPSFDDFQFSQNVNDNTNEIKLDLSHKEENKDQIKLDLNEKESEFKPSFDGFTFQSASNDNTNEIHLDLSEEDLHR